VPGLKEKNLVQTSTTRLSFRYFFPSNGVLLSEDNRFVDEAFGNGREIEREPSVDPAFERANPGDSFGPQQQRHPGAGRFVGSRAVENDVATQGNLSVALFDLFHRYTKRARDHLRKRLDIHGLAQVHD
jgi:hypothetical protein